MVRYARTKKEAQEKLDQLRAEQQGGGLSVESRRETVAEYLHRWLDDLVRSYKAPNTYRSYEGVVRLHIIPNIGRVKLTDLKPRQVQALYSAMEKVGASPRLRQLAHAVLHRAFSLAVKHGAMWRNPCAQVERPRAKAKAMHPLTPEEAQRLLGTARNHRLWALLVTAVATGMRQGELFALEWRDVDLEAAAVTVRHSLEEINGRLRLKETKTAKSRRRIDLPRFAVEALLEHRRRMLAGAT